MMKNKHEERIMLQNCTLVCNKMVGFMNYCNLQSLVHNLTKQIFMEAPSFLCISL